MTGNAEELQLDVGRLGPELADDESAAELYRALANSVWRKDGGTERHVSLSWKRADSAGARSR